MGLLDLNQSKASDTPVVAPADGAPVVDVQAAANPVANPEVAAVVAPEGLPEGLWADGKLNVDAIKALHEEATKFKTTQSEREALLPKDGVYTIALPSDLKDDAGQPIKIDETAPAYKVLLEASKELKLTPAEANGFAEKMVRLQLEEARADMKAEADRVAGEQKLLGENYKARIETLRNGFVAQLGEDTADLFAGVNTAKGVIAAERLLAKLTGTNLSPTAQPTQQQTALPAHERIYGSRA